MSIIFLIILFIIISNYSSNEATANRRQIRDAYKDIVNSKNNK